MKPICGPAFGLVIKLRAFEGVPTLLSAREIVPRGRASTAARLISSILRAAASMEVPGAKRT
jgi:hypothetical protein